MAATHANVVIVGAGPAGLAAAIHLGQLGVPGVVLVDRADFLAAEAIAAMLLRREEEAVAAARFEAECRRAFQRSFKGAAVWRRMVGAGGLDVLARGFNLPPVQRVLARGMAKM